MSSQWVDFMLVKPICQEIPSSYEKSFLDAHVLIKYVHFELFK